VNISVASPRVEIPELNAARQPDRAARIISSSFAIPINNRIGNSGDFAVW
jgi:hypothetical protein